MFRAHICHIIITEISKYFTWIFFLYERLGGVRNQITHGTHFRGISLLDIVNQAWHMA